MKCSRCNRFTKGAGICEACSLALTGLYRCSSCGEARVADQFRWRVGPERRRYSVCLICKPRGAEVCKNCGTKLRSVSVDALYCSACSKRMRGREYYAQDPEKHRRSSLETYRKRNLRLGSRCSECDAPITFASRTGVCKACCARQSQARRLQATDFGLSQAASQAQATRRGYVWTGPELELVARTDLRPGQVARMLNRTTAAVRRQRYLLNVDPRVGGPAGTMDR